ncbi:hypothetical protein GE09DRAFT_1289600 [Coniochaeta sp. 2T2.1]|nr:hypothetical protein GE09DRAFT_1289600 [Coniochaeta sp. 2T2.1]
MSKRQSHVMLKGESSRGLGAAVQPDPFVISTSLESIKPDAKSRKLIRRYVTKGKKINRPKRLKRAVTSWFGGRGVTPDGHPAGICRGLAVDILDPKMLQVLHDFVPIMVKVMYPVEHCVDLATENQHWHDDLAQDIAYAQSVSTIASVYFDIIRSRNQELQKLMHMGTSLGPLRAQLAAGTDVAVTDSTIFTVVALALRSEDLDATSTHMHGLQQMIRLRGGISALSTKRSLQIKCCRIDLALAMRTGTKPLLFTSPELAWKPYLADPATSPRTYPWRDLFDSSDIRLVNIYLDLSEFTRSLNLAHQTKRKIGPPALFQEVLISAQYRLHHLSYPSHDIQETLRLAMLAFSASLFLSAPHSPHTRPVLDCNKGLAAAFADSLLLRVLERKKDDRRDPCLELDLCLAFLGRVMVSVLDLAEQQRSQLGETIARTAPALGLTAWTEVRRVLKRFLWVDVIHDEPGRRIFDTASAGTLEDHCAAWLNPQNDDLR